MTINSKQKGKRGELEFARVCREHGYDQARRGQQYSGIEGEDVVGLPGIHVEVKRQENVSIEAALIQAQRDAQGKPAIVAHRKNRERWRVTMDIEDFFELYREWEAGKSLEEVGV